MWQNPGHECTGGRVTVERARRGQQAQVEQVSREFATVFHDLKDQTFATTTWLQVPLVKTAADIIVLQQIIAETRPELIVETGAYVGGSACCSPRSRRCSGSTAG